MDTEPLTSIAFVQVPADVHDSLVRQAQEAYPHECCGIIIGCKVAGAVIVTRAIPAKNITTSDPSRNYQIDWKVLLTTRRQLRGTPESIVGFYHSHPDASAWPSSLDSVHAWPDHVYLIIPVSAGRVAEPVAWYARPSTPPQTQTAKLDVGTSPVKAAVAKPSPAN